MPGELGRRFEITINGRHIDHHLEIDTDKIEVEVWLNYTGVIDIQPLDVFVFQRESAYYGWIGGVALEEAGDGIWKFKQIVLRSDASRSRTYDFFFTHPLAPKTRHLAVHVIGRADHGQHFS